MGTGFLAWRKRALPREAAGAECSVSTFTGQSSGEASGADYDKLC
jgi:hypothetical protein